MKALPAIDVSDGDATFVVELQSNVTLTGVEPWWPAIPLQLMLPREFTDSAAPSQSVWGLRPRSSETLNWISIPDRAAGRGGIGNPRW